MSKGAKIQICSVCGIRHITLRIDWKALIFASITSPAVSRILSKTLLSCTISAVRKCRRNRKVREK